MSDLSRKLQQALALHRGGRLLEAKAAYEALLARLPDNPDVQHLLGTLTTQLGRPAEAVPLIQRAIRRQPTVGAYHSHLAEALAATGRGAEAETAWREAIRLNPNDAEANFGLAGRLAQGARWAEAEAFARRAAELLPGVAPTRFRLGIVLEGLGRAGEALALFREVARAAPAEEEVYRRILITAIAAGDMAAAWSAVRRSMALRPAVTGGCIAVDAVVHGQVDADAKLRWARRGAVMHPADATQRAISAGRRVDFGDYQSAIDEARQAIVAGPGVALGYVSRARATIMVPQFDLTRRAVRLGLCVAPGDLELIYQQAQVEKAAGDLALGWRLEERRIAMPRFHRMVALPPRWEGPGQAVGRLLVATEQGIGDELLFLSCLPELLRDVPDPVVELDERLHPLYRRSFPGLEMVPRQAYRIEAGRAIFDYARVNRDYGITHYIHAGSLPGLYRSDRARPADRVGYLRPDGDAVRAWRQRLAALGPEPTVGICWRSFLRFGVRSAYYAPLEAWKPLLRLQGIRFVSLQYDDCRAEVEALRDELGVDLWLPDGLDQMDDLDGTAALIAALDTVVSAPTAVCMMAAAVGVPTYRVGHTTYSIGRTRDHFFPNLRPLASWGEPLDLAKALTRAAEILPDALAR